MKSSKQKSLFYTALATCLIYSQVSSALTDPGDGIFDIPFCDLIGPNSRIVIGQERYYSETYLTFVVDYSYEIINPCGDPIGNTTETVHPLFGIVP